MYARMSSDKGSNQCHLVDSYTLLIELSSPSVKSVVYVKADLRLMNVAFNPKFR